MATNPLFDSRVELIIVGEFYEKIKKYHRQIKKLGLASRIQIIDKFVSFEVVRDYFCAADIIVQPYKTATQSGVTPLAYNYETPIVVTNLTGLKKPILIDNTGEISEPNPLELSEKIKLLLDPERQEKAIKKYHKKIRINTAGSPTLNNGLILFNNIFFIKNIPLIFLVVYLFCKLKSIIYCFT